MRPEVLRAGAGSALLLLMWSTSALATSANELCAANADPCVVATAVAVTNLSVIDVGQRELRINAGGALDVGGGTMTIRAGRLTVNANGFVRAAGSTSVAGGILDIEAGTVSVLGGIEANGAPGGTIDITSPGAVSVAGSGLSARALLRSEVGGTINLRAADATLGSTISVLGGFDALGGDVTVTAAGTVVITGTIDATGGDGGSIDIEAGVAPGAGDVVLADASSLKVDATTAGGFGGTIDVFAHGDGVTHGHVTADGLVSAPGRGGGEETGGGAGGCITLTADGDVTNTRAAATITTAGGGPDGDGGEVEISSNHGQVRLRGTIDSGSGGTESSGGSVTVDAFTDAIVGGTITTEAGDGGGGEITISSATTSVQVERTATIEADGNAGGAGGAICLDGGFSAVSSQTIVVEGKLSASGRTGAGTGGTIELSGGDAVRVATTASVRADGGVAGGSGGTITVDVANGPALLDGSFGAAGTSPSGTGGAVSVDASQRILLTAPVDATGVAGGGMIGLASTGAVDVRANLLARATNGAGGAVEIVSEGEVMLAASLIADGTALPGAGIDVEGCAVTLCGLNSPICPSGGTGILSSLGPNGRNRVTGRESANVFGTMRADAATGHNQILYDGAPEREPLVLGTVVPPAELIVSEDVRRCPACGNDVIDPPETCDDGNQLDGDGCSHTCQVEAPIPGDANGDYVLAAADRDFAIAEIFDGDGDAIGTVSGGTFPGAPGADANDDGFVTAADLVAITQLLAP